MRHVLWLSAFVNKFIKMENTTQNSKITEEAKVFLLAHSSCALLMWNRHSTEEKVNWILHLKNNKESAFFDECIRLINDGGF